MLVRPGIRALLLALVALALGAVPALAAPSITGEFAVPGALDDNNKLAQGPDGNIWVTLGGGGDDVARITPAGAVEEFDLGAENPQGIAAVGDRLWITREGGVISFDPDAPEDTEESTNIAAINGFHSIVLGPDGNLWAAANDDLVRISPADPNVNKSFELEGLSPRDIDVAGALLVIADAGTEDQVLMATTADPPVITALKLNGAPQGVAGGPNGQFAFTQPGEEPKEIGVVNPGATPLINFFPGADPFGIALGSDGAYWSPESNGERLIRVTAGGQATFLNGFAAGSRPRQITAGPVNTLWVTLTESDKVGRVSGLEPPVGPPRPPVQPPPTSTRAPETRIGKGPKGEVPTTGKRAKVKFTFSSPQAGAAFECRVVRLGGGKAKAPKAPRFSACRSPKTFRLKPGRYRFEVRAVVRAVRDETPAKRSFKVVKVFPTER